MSATGLTCATCSKPNPPLRCSGCSSVNYCSERCQKSHRKVHKGECKVIREKLGNGNPVEVVGTSALAPGAKVDEWTVDPGISFTDEDREKLKLLPELLSLVMTRLGDSGQKKTLLKMMLSSKSVWNLGRNAMFGKLKVNDDNVANMQMRFESGKDLRLLKEVHVDEIKKETMKDLRDLVASFLRLSPQPNFRTSGEAAVVAVFAANDRLVRGAIGKIVVQGLNDFRTIGVLSMAERTIEVVEVIKPDAIGMQYVQVIEGIMKEAKRRRKWSIGEVRVVGARPTQGETIDDVKAFWKVVPGKVSFDRVVE